MLDKILNNLHPAINRDPQANPAISITGSGTVIIKDDIMQIIGASSAQFSLSGYTLGSLTSAINQISGISATCNAPTNLSALVLISGSWPLPITVSLFTSFLWQLMKPVALAIIAALDAESQSLLEMVQNTSEGAWLDSFGELFGVDRETGEPDSMYASRIFDLSLGIRINNVAIQKTLQDVGYESVVADSGATNFTVNLTIPTNTQQGFVYSTAQVRDIIDQIRPSGISYQILSQGSASDTANLVESIATITATGAIKYSVRKWGQMTWA